MHTPESTPAVSPAPAVSWRVVLLWFVFAATLATGLLLALQFGGSTPAMIDGGFR